MKKQHLILLLVFLLQLPYLFSQNTLLWEISGRRVKGKSYLYGTMHTTDARAFEFNDSLNIVFAKCDAFAMEFTPDEENMNIVLQSMYLDEGESLKDLYSEEDYQFLKEAVRETLGMNIQMFDRMKPFFLMSMFMQANMKTDKPYVVDYYLYNKALEKEMRTLSIEKVSEQIEAIKKTPPEALIEYIRGGDEAEEMMEELIDAYRTQNLEKMLEISERDTTNEEMMEALVNIRNHTMEKRIRRIIRRQPTFIAVGALHLPGEDGVIKLLQNRGYTVRPIYAPYNSLKGAE